MKWCGVTLLLQSLLAERVWEVEEGPFVGGSGATGWIGGVS